MATSAAVRSGGGMMMALTLRLSARVLADCSSSCPVYRLYNCMSNGAAGLARTSCSQLGRFPTTLIMIRHLQTSIGELLAICLYVTTIAYSMMSRCLKYQLVFGVCDLSFIVQLEFRMRGLCSH